MRKSGENKKRQYKKSGKKSDKKGSFKGYPRLRKQNRDNIRLLQKSQLDSIKDQIESEIKLSADELKVMRKRIQEDISKTDKIALAKAIRDEQKFLRYQISLLKYVKGGIKKSIL